MKNVLHAALALAAVFAGVKVGRDISAHFFHA